MCVQNLWNCTQNKNAHKSQPLILCKHRLPASEDSGRLNEFRKIFWGRICARRFSQRVVCHCFPCIPSTPREFCRLHIYSLLKYAVVSYVHWGITCWVFSYLIIFYQTVANQNIANARQVQSGLIFYSFPKGQLTPCGS